MQGYGKTAQTLIEWIARDEPNTDSLLRFNLEPYDSVDEIALLACQEGNFGNSGNWFLLFRKGLYSALSRLYGVALHFFEMHTWTASVRHPLAIDYHLSSLLFHMDSAVECLTFSLNALGYGICPDLFRDIGDPKQLRRVKPNDVQGEDKNGDVMPEPKGYSILFPSVREYWQVERELLGFFMEHHDVSKHRHATFVGGSVRRDAPHEFFSSFGVPPDSPIALFFAPQRETLMDPNPKQLLKADEGRHLGDMRLLEDVVPQFRVFMDGTGQRLIEDVQQTIHLKAKDREAPGLKDD